MFLTALKGLPGCLGMTESHKGFQAPESSCKSHHARVDAQLEKVAWDTVSQGFVRCLAGAEPQHGSSSVTQPGPGSRNQELTQEL